MAWTSHAYHVAKDFQTLGAAGLAFAAAGLTFYAQRWVADRNARAASDNIAAQAADQKLKDALTEKRFNRAFLIAFDAALQKIGSDAVALHAQTGLVIDHFEKVSEHEIKVDQKSITWSRFSAFNSFLDGHSLLMTELSELAKLDEFTQRKVFAALSVCRSIESSVREVKRSLEEHQTVLQAYFDGIQTHTDTARDMVDKFRKDIAHQLSQ